MNTNQTLLAVLFLAGGTFSTASSHAAVDSRAFGEVWQSQGEPSREQAQVIYYRSQGISGNDAAMVYVDGEFQAALLPGMFTRFCVKPGEHSLGAYRNDAPAYQGKNEQRYRAAFKGGNTYYVRVDDNVNGRPNAVRSAQAAKELKTLRLQKHALSRASAVVACDYSTKPAVDYTLFSDVLFKFGKSGQGDIQAQGRQALAALAKQLRHHQQHPNHIEVIGHTDAIGREQDNQRLGEVRAFTVRQILIDGGIPAANIRVRSVGSEEPVTLCKQGSAQEKVACNAPNRRVVIRVETTR